MDVVLPIGRVQVIRDKYGELLSIEEIADLYKFPSVEAVKKAHSRGKLAVSLYKVPGRPGLFAKADEVARSIDELVPCPAGGDM
ncbi:MAG: hypothetical protein ACR2OW_08845 [Methyloligellaceae bacterium]|jgi:hypothetical protein